MSCVTSSHENKLSLKSNLDLGNSSSLIYENSSRYSVINLMPGAGMTKPFLFTLETLFL